MKLKIIFVVSLVLNTALMMALIALLAGRTRSEDVTTPGPLEIAAQPVVSPVIPAEPVRPSDLSSWIKHARAAGISGELLAAMAVADFDRQRREREREFDVRYWRGYEDNASRLRFDREREIELERTLRSALGDDGFVQWDKAKVLSAFEGVELTATETDALYRLQKDWDNRIRDFEQRKLSGDLQEAEYERELLAASDEFEARRKALIGEERYLAMLEPRDTFYVELRRSLGNATLNDSEFDALVEFTRSSDVAREKVEQRLAARELSLEDRDRLIAEIDAAKQMEFDRILGADGYVNFQKRQDTRYQVLKQYAGELQLTTADVDHLYEIVRNFGEKAREYRTRARQIETQGQQVDWAGVEQNLQLFTRHTEQLLRSYLGEEQFSKLAPADLLRVSDN